MDCSLHFCSALKKTTFKYKSAGRLFYVRCVLYVALLWRDTFSSPECFFSTLTTQWNNVRSQFINKLYFLDLITKALQFMSPSKIYILSINTQKSREYRKSYHHEAVLKETCPMKQTVRGASIENLKNNHRTSCKAFENSDVDALFYGRSETLLRNLNPES